MSKAVQVGDGNEVNVYLDEGVPWSVDLTLTDADDVPIDLTGRTIEMECRRAPGDATVLLRKDNGATGGITHTGAAGGITISFGESDVVGLAWQQAEYDVKVNGIARVIQGTLFVERQVTV